MTRAIPWLALLLTPACAPESPSPSATTGAQLQQNVDYHRGVMPILQSHCASCHQPGGVAPFPLTTFVQVHGMRDVLLRAITDRRMPPWLAAPGCNQYQDDPTLSDAQIETITRWVKAGAPEGEGPVSQPFTPSHRGGLSRVDRTLSMPVDYVPRTHPDDYRCFVLDWPDARTRYITGFSARPGNNRTVHHIIAYRVPPDLASQAHDLENADATAGYACFGGSGLGESGIRSRAAARSTTWLGSWAPGGQGGDFPPGTGVKMEPGSAVVIQVHYNSPTAAVTADRSAVDFKVDDTVMREAVALPVADPAWREHLRMPIPRGQPDVMHRFATDITAEISVITSGRIPEGPLLLHTVGLHMHQRGSRGSLRLLRQDGTTGCVLEIPRWDFNWQDSYRLVHPIRVEPGDRLLLECHWNNASGSRDINWGEGTGDEMCLGILYVSAP